MIYPDFMDDGLVPLGTPVKHVVDLTYPDGHVERREVTEIVKHDDGSYSMFWDAAPGDPDGTAEPSPI